MEYRQICVKLLPASTGSNEKEFSIFLNENTSNGFYTEISGTKFLGVYLEDSVGVFLVLLRIKGREMALTHERDGQSSVISVSKTLANHEYEAISIYSSMYNISDLTYMLNSSQMLEYFIDKIIVGKVAFHNSAIEKKLPFSDKYSDISLHLSDLQQRLPEDVRGKLDMSLGFMMSIYTDNFLVNLDLTARYLLAVCEC